MEGMIQELPQTTIDKMSSLFDKGVTRSAIAKQLNISRSVVYKYIPASASTSESERRKKIIIDKYNSGKDIKEIQEEMNISKSTVDRALKEVPKRKAKRAIKINKDVEKDTIITEKSYTSEIKVLWLKGKTMSQISRDLKIGFTKVKQTIIDLGMEDYTPQAKNQRQPRFLYKRLWVPERRFWVETYSEEEYNEKVEKYAAK